MKQAARGAWRGPRIALRLLAFNVLVVFVPVVGVLYLGAYEERLLDLQERAMVQQARILAAALGGAPAIEIASARKMFERLRGRSDARLRLFDRRGVLMADSLGVSEPARDDASSRADSGPGERDIRGGVLYRAGMALQAIRSAVFSGAGLRKRVPKAPAAGTYRLSAADAEVAAALEGRYGAATRRTRGQRSLTLYSAVPVRDADIVVGAVVVSQSTFRILQALYDVRLRIFRIVVASILVAACLTTLASTTIVRPLTRLRRAATSLAERRSPLASRFPGVDRHDEIGELARALDDLTHRLSAQIALLEGFAADVAHEFRNPLAGIRTAAETIDACDDAQERSRFAALMMRDVSRLEQRLSGLRDLTHIDRRLEETQTRSIDVKELVTTVANRARAENARTVRIEVTGGAAAQVEGDSESLAQVLENVLINAVSFAPEGSTVDVDLSRRADEVAITIADRGPGLPELHLQRVFDRFFSYRPAESGRDHLGIGLAIAKRIVEAHGGTITAANRSGGGAVFEMRLPSPPRRGDGADA